MLTYIARAVGIPARQVGAPCFNSGDFAGLAVQNPRVKLCWQGGDGITSGGPFLWNHNWVEYWDDVSNQWVFINVPPQNSIPNQGLCNTFSYTTGCDYTPKDGCQGSLTGPALASRDHEIFSVTWHNIGEGENFDGGPIVNVKDFRLSSGEFASPLVWSPFLESPLGQPMKDFLRVVNRTEFYRCKAPPGTQ